MSAIPSDNVIDIYLETLTGEVDAELIAMPELPPSGPDTPAPDLELRARLNSPDHSRAASPTSAS